MFVEASEWAAGSAVKRTSKAGSEVRAGAIGKLFSFTFVSGSLSREYPVLRCMGDGAGNAHAAHGFEKPQHVQTQTRRGPCQALDW